jgi:cytochrome bd-type quinol oxidase subunit 1
VINASLLVSSFLVAIAVWRHARGRMSGDRALMWALVSFVLFPLGPIAYLWAYGRKVAKG